MKAFLLVLVKRAMITPKVLAQSDEDEEMKMVTTATTHFWKTRVAVGMSLEEQGPGRVKSVCKNRLVTSGRTKNYSSNFSIPLVVLD